MNLHLQKIFSSWYHHTQINNKLGGASSVEGTTHLRDLLGKLFEKHQIQSIFDAGCNDCNWMSIVSKHVEYHGGDISLGMVSDAWMAYPDLDVMLHDITTDPIPNVDLLFVKDVAIHLSNQDRRKLWNNWYQNNVPWILITHSNYVDQNFDLEYSTEKFPFSSVNWEISPWKFPKPTEYVIDTQSNHMALWHRDQFQGIL